MDTDAVGVNPEIRTQPDRRILYVTAQRSDHATFDDACRAAIGALFQEVGSKGIPWIPGTFGVESPHGGDPTGELGVDPAYAKAFVIIEMEQDVPPFDIVKDGVLSGGRELVGMHVGPYQGLLVSWPMLERHRNEIGERVRDDFVYDLYIDDAQTTPEAELRTEMHIPLE